MWLIIAILLVLFWIHWVQCRNNAKAPKDDNLCPKYNKNVRRGKDGRYKSIKE